ncbi:TonB-dependent receptor domain-containing protein [Lysobacter yangpyeongensis]|uniref:TonB-dependent receptor domain-containing protein n=1 Tax=Lysobacter yangpyeongensis TaxID=346182 RepID=A0ABW0SKH0_9GAMM
MKAKRLVSKRLRKSALCAAMGLCLSSGLLWQPAFAANTDGSLVGRTTPGATVTVRSPDTGFTRTVTADAEGNYRFPFLPVGNYQVEATRDGQQVTQPLQTSISLGNATVLNMGGGDGATNLAAVQVTGSRVITPVDVTSTESATNIRREEIERLPVQRDITDVATLAPGVNRGEFGGISFGGSSVAENTVYINGLNVTDFYNRVGFSSLPFSFLDEFQIKTGGYSVEYGRSTGGVINAVTRRGTNEFQGGVDLVVDGLWQAEGENHPNLFRRWDESRQNDYAAWGSGALIQDRLFFFGIYEKRDLDSQNTDDGGENFFDNRGDNDFWGAKLDWQINDANLLELFGFSDKSKTVSDNYEFDTTTGRRGQLRNTVTSENGGDNWAATYTGYFTDNFSMKAMYGENERSASALGANDDRCSLVQDRRMSDSFLGCTSNTSVIDRNDTREATRLDFEWNIGDHLLRFGADHETNTSDYNSHYPGDGLRYEVNNAGARVNGVDVPAGTVYVRTRQVANQGTFETENAAYYIEDNWNVTSNLLLNLGVRVESFDNKDAAGHSYIKLDNMVAPRFGFSWDMNGDGRSKLFGNAGRYYLPVANVINIKQAGPFLDARRFYFWDGTFAPGDNPIPGLGPEIGTVDDSQGDGSVADLRGEVDKDMDPVYQDEYILGFQQVLGEKWSWGVSGTYRKMHNAIDDMEVVNACGDSGFVMGNPGQDLTYFTDTDCDGESDGFVTIDTSKTGWELRDGTMIGWVKPERTYKAVELQLDRAWDDKWSFNATYVWSQSKGNYEGPVNSDTDFSDSGRTEAFDNPFVEIGGYGYLPNDHRHQIKLRGNYAITDHWIVGASLDAKSGRPMSEYGAGNPFDDNEFLTHYICESEPSLCYTPDGQWRLAQRGTYDTLPWTYNLGASLAYNATFGRVKLNAKFAVYNLLNDQRVIERNETRQEEEGVGLMNPFFGQGTAYQSPRSAQFILSLVF